MSRLQSKDSRVYIDGFDMSGYAKSAPQMNFGFSEAAWQSIVDDVNGVLPGQAMISLGVFNTVLDNTATSGIHAALSSSDAVRSVMIALGALGAPAAGDPVFCAQVGQLNYQPVIGKSGVVTATIKFGNSDQRGDSLDYDNPWGTLLHAKAAKTAANSSGTAQESVAAQTSLGGYMMYHVISSDGTVAIQVQDSTEEVNGSYGALLTSGDVDASSSPKHGIVTLAKNATVEKYTRWQIALNTATTVTFLVAFVRGR